MRKEEKSDATLRACCVGRVVLVNASGIAIVLPLSAEEAAVAKDLAESLPSIPEPGTSTVHVTHALVRKTLHETTTLCLPSRPGIEPPRRF